MVIGQLHIQGRPIPTIGGCEQGTCLKRHFERAQNFSPIMDKVIENEIATIGEDDLDLVVHLIYKCK